MFPSLLTLALAVALVVFAFVWKARKGKRGERMVASRLSWLPKEDYLVINDLLLQSGGYSTQIDHVVISVYGIFVIETKFYKGWIFCSENKEYWQQNIYRHKYQLRNPVWQNQGHIKAIRRVLEDTGILPIYSIVAFSSQARLKGNRPTSVMYWRNIVPFIKGFSEPKMSKSYVNDIYEKLVAANVTDKQARKQHVSNVKYNQSKRDRAVSNGICPLCGGTLVKRKGQYGYFFGCSNYPKCKYILKSL